MEIALGVILLLSIIGLVWYCFKGHNIMVGFFLMALLWLVVSLVGHFTVAGGNSAFGDRDPLNAVVFAIFQVFQVGPQNFSSSILTNIFFGAFFGRVLLETNIASTLIKKTVELGGDRPRITVALLSIITAILFVNMTGIGPVMAIAVIVIPILLTIGIPSKVALFSFVGSIMAGILVNPINFAQYHEIIKSAIPAGADFDGFRAVVNGFTYGDYALFGWIGLAICVTGVILVSNFMLSKSSKTYAWAVDSPSAHGQIKKDAPWYSWLAILIPVALITGFNLMGTQNTFSVIFAFIIAAIYALITTGNLKGGYRAVCARLAKYFADGALEAAPMIGFLLALSMFNTAGGLNAAYLGAIVGGIIPSTALALAIMFALLAVFSFFRGPINLVGSGAAFATIVFTSIGSVELAALSFPFIYILFSVTTIVPQHLDITQSWVAWSFGYTNVNPRDYMKYSIPTGYVLSIVLCILAFVMYGVL